MSKIEIRASSAGMYSPSIQATPPAIRAGGVQFVVAVLDHRARRGVLPDGAGFDGDEVAGAEVCDGHDDVPSKLL